MSLILNPTRSRLHTAYGIEYETTTFGTGVTCTIPTDEPSRAADLASVIVEGCAKSPMEYEDFRDAGFRTLQIKQTLQEAGKVKRCNVYASPDEFIVKDPVDDGHGSMQFFYMNALSRALKEISGGVYAVSAPAIITTENGRSFTIFDKAPGSRMIDVIFDWRHINKEASIDKKREVDTIVAERIADVLKKLRPEYIVKKLTNDHPAHKKRYYSGPGNTYLDIDSTNLTKDSLQEAPIWLIDQAHPTILTKQIHKIARHFPIVSAK